MALASQLFARKPLSLLLEEMEGENRLRRVLGPVQLTSLGVGAIIGAGIFVATGAAARNVAGPALMLSYIVAGMTCVFAALCYAEFASMVPVAGSAYTYAYATLGEMFAWIIGWDLVLEYAVGSATVANGWSGLSSSRCCRRSACTCPRRSAGPPIVYDAARGQFVATGRHRQSARRDRRGRRDGDPGEGHPGERALQRQRWSASSWPRCCS